MAMSWKTVFPYMFITPTLATFFHTATGTRRSMLPMAVPLGTMWLAVLTTLYLNTRCMNSWTLFWQVCNEKSPHYQHWSMSIGDHSILEPKQDGLTLAKWLVAEKVSGDIGDTKLFLRWRISCTSNSLEHGQQASLLAVHAPAVGNLCRNGTALGCLCAFVGASSATWSCAKLDMLTVRCDP